MQDLDIFLLINYVKQINLVGGVFWLMLWSRFGKLCAVAGFLFIRLSMDLCVSVLFFCECMRLDRVNLLPTAFKIFIYLCIYFSVTVTLTEVLRVRIQSHILAALLYLSKINDFTSTYLTSSVSVLNDF